MDNKLDRFVEQMGLRMLEEVQEELQKEPKPIDEGKFIRNGELYTWWRSMQQRYPTIYKSDDRIFGEDDTQHILGTKLMAFFDNDPNKPMRVEVRGSRWHQDERRPMYVVKFKGMDSLEQIDLGSAHEEGGWVVGWGDDDDDKLETGKAKKSADDKDANCENEEAEETQCNLSGPSFYEAVCTHEGASDSKEYEDWNVKSDGPFEDSFLNCMFSLEEQVALRSGDGLMSNLENMVNRASSEFEVRAIIMRLVLAWTEENVGGVILRNRSDTKFQAIEFDGPSRTSSGVPLVELTYAICHNKEAAEFFLRGEKIKEMDCSGQAAAYLGQHILEYCNGGALRDLGSGALLYNGYLAPTSILTAATIKTNGIQDLMYAEMPNKKFGIEVELSCATGIQRGYFANTLQKHTRLPVMYNEKQSQSKGKPSNKKSTNDIPKSLKSSENMSRAYSGSTSLHRYEEEWKLVYDRSIRGSFPNNSALELVSPILCGEAGLDESNQVLSVMTDISSVQINESMGLHVHINVEELSLQDLVRVCENFVRYEDIIDTFMSPQRRTGSKESDQYFQSNRVAVMGRCERGEQWQEKMKASRTMDEICDLMNPTGRYYKLNLQNLKTGRQPTVEFRQHSATCDNRQVEPWVRFCMAFVHNSATMTETALHNGTEDDFEALFESVVKDVALGQFYRK